MFLNEFFLQKKSDYYSYSPYSFIQTLDPNRLLDETIINPFLKDIDNNKLSVKIITVHGKEHYFLVRYLDWDTNYFGFPHYRIELIIYNHNEVDLLNSAIIAFIDGIKEYNAYYFFEIPCEDIKMIQAFSSTKFKLIETRLHFYFNLMNTKLGEDRYPVRFAALDDIPAIKKVAIKMRNNFDRVHADPAYSNIIADEYIGKYAEECVKGFADFVFIPDIPGIPASGFAAGKNPHSVLNMKISKLLVTAIDKDMAKGWLKKMQIEILNYLANNGAQYVMCNTQASNKPSMYSLYKTNFILGRTTHIFSYQYTKL